MSITLVHASTSCTFFSKEWSWDKLFTISSLSNESGTKSDCCHIFLIWKLLVKATQNLDTHVVVLKSIIWIKQMKIFPIILFKIIDKVFLCHYFFPVNTGHRNFCLYSSQARIYELYCIEYCFPVVYSWQVDWKLWRQIVIFSFNHSRKSHVHGQ